MKELSIEQKAQRYDKAYEKIATRFGSNVADEIFFELEGSKDEKIKKCISDIIKEYNWSHIYGVTKNDCINWLEEQVKYNNFRNKIQIGDKVTRNEYGVLVNLSQLNRSAIKQGKQKPVDKIEPKFKVDDWIIYKDSTWKICNIPLLNYYELLKINNEVSIRRIEDVDKNARLWTIENAKDGDVLVIQKTDITYESIFIFNKIENNHIIQHLHYFTTDAGEEVCEARSIGGFLGFVGETVHPATKEQRDILIKTMDNKGYSFDFKKKELKKIEHNPWNEEDERMYQSILVNTVQKNQLDDKQIAWIESLKERITNIN